MGRELEQEEWEKHLEGELEAMHDGTNEEVIKKFSGYWSCVNKEHRDPSGMGLRRVRHVKIPPLRFVVWILSDFVPILQASATNKNREIDNKQLPEKRGENTPTTWTTTTTATTTTTVAAATTTRKTTTKATPKESRATNATSYCKSSSTRSINRNSSRHSKYKGHARLCAFSLVLICRVSLGHPIAQEQAIWKSNPMHRIGDRRAALGHRCGATRQAELVYIKKLGKAACSKKGAFMHNLFRERWGSIV